MRFEFRRAGLCLGVVLGVLFAQGRGNDSKYQEDGDYGSSYEKIVGRPRPPSDYGIKAFRPRTAREAFRHAGRIAEREAKKEPKQSVSILFDNTRGGRPIRVEVEDVVEVTTSSYSFRSFRGFRRSRKLPARNEWPDSSGIEDPPSIERPAVRNKFGHRRTVQKADMSNYGNQKKTKRSRRKRDVDDTSDTGFNLPPMSNEWKVKIKKKKKKKKKKSTEAPATKKMQTKSKKFRLYLESGELDLDKAKGRRTDIMGDLSKELDDLLKDEDFALATSAPQEHRVTSKRESAKFVEVPKNWQSPPPWRPPTLRPKVHGIQVKRRQGIVTIGPQAYKENIPEYVEETTQFDWRNYENPLNPSTHKIGEFKPAPQDWPQPTHPSDGIYDWHKSQIRLGHPNPRPHYATSGPDTRYSTRVWPRMSKDEANIYQRNDMWQTRPWIPHVKSLSTWPPILTRPASSNMFEKEPEGNDILEDTPQVLGRKGNQRKAGLMEEVHLTAGPPLAPLEQPLEVGVPQTGSGSVLSNNAQETHQYSYHYGPHHSSWQSNTQGQHKSSHGVEQYQSYQNYHANHTSQSVSQYYQHYETRLGNRSAEVHYEQGQHYEDPVQASGHYQANYQYQERPKAERQQLPQQQLPRIMPPAYFYKVHNELTTLNPGRSTVRVPFRGPDEYAGNDRDLRAPMPQKLVFEIPEGPGSLYPTRGWLGYRFNRLGPRRGFTSRFRRPMFRSMFKAPLQKDTWTTTAPETK